MGQAAPTAPGRDRFGTAASDTAAEGLAGARPPPSAVVSVRSGRRPAPHGGGQYVDGPARSYSPSAADQDTGTLRCGHTPPASSGTGTGHDRHRPHRRTALLAANATSALSANSRTAPTEYGATRRPAECR
ncbi:hypothetical protein TPA0910_31740 [Streptomyces hygroscopicus subsp. sporocinereus]|uniref:Uncharacterized protein n=1 Tax=Streptomyces hygroscopicus TaxID=1912 RepID=A0ABQ3U044_STRHY|nr:hypothetical protein TPA0910_31740 [Streptomyces hygroscopicus]